MDLAMDRLPAETLSSARFGSTGLSFPLEALEAQFPPPEPSEASKMENGESTAAAGELWPGSHFKLETIMPDSIYLWACGEPFGGENQPRVSRSQAAAAWIILMTQAVCYVGLWYVSGNHPPADGEDSGEEENPSKTSAAAEHNSPSETPFEYSILAIAGAMYLVLSIAAADVWSGAALIVEGRGPGFVLFTRRRIFGVFLLATFCTLLGASIRVLFYSSKENVQLVLGAAAVLFIADVDEKAMSVLKNVHGEWVLFWVLQLFGLSCGLAVFAVKVTGNTFAVGSKDRSLRCIASSDVDCDIFNDIFDWWFFLSAQPTAVTIGAFLLTSVIARPTTSIAGRTIFPRSWKWFVITLAMLCWVGQTPLWLVHSEASIWFDSSSGGIALVLVMICYRGQLTRANCTQILRRGLRQGGHRLLILGVLVMVLEFILYVVFVSLSGDDNKFYYKHVYETCINIMEVAVAGLYLIVYLWLINGLRLANLRSADLDSNVEPVSFLKPFVLGWGLSEGYYGVTHWIFVLAWKLEDEYPKSVPGIVLAENVLDLTWHVGIGTVIWGQRAGARGLAYWTATTLLRTVVVGCVSAWVSAWVDEALK